MNSPPPSHQVWAAVSSGLVLAGLISVWGYPATALPQLTLAATPLLSPSQASWFSACDVLFSCFDLMSAKSLALFGCIC